MKAKKHKNLRLKGLALVTLLQRGFLFVEKTIIEYSLTIFTNNGDNYYV